MLKLIHIVAKLALITFIVFAPRAQAVNFEVGQATTNDTTTTASFKTITFAGSFDAVPIVVVLTRNENPEPVLVKVKNVSTTSFQIAPIEPHNEDGVSPAMSVDYIAIEPGVHTLPDGTVIAAGFHTTSTVQAHSSLGLTTGWDTVSFGTTFSADAMVLAGTQTFNSETANVPAETSDPFIAVAMQNAGPSSIQMALERAESDGGPVSAETIGWIAMQSGTSGSFSDSSNNTISWDARNSSDSITSNCTLATFSSTAWPSAHVISSQILRGGNNGGWVRRCSLSGTQIGLEIDEDQSNDDERNHTTEAVSLLAFSGSFHAEFSGEISASKSVALIEDPVNGATNPYALPGARLRYSIMATSLGTIPVDLDTVIIKDGIPDNVRLVVSDIGLPSDGPVLFEDGTPSSDLNLDFISLSSLSDDIEFSVDGTDFTYAPIAGGDGTDSNVKYIRITPSGSFAAETTAGSPNFTVSFDVILQ